MLRPSVSTADLTKLVDSVCSAAKGAEGGDVAQQGRALDGLKALKKQQVTTKLLSDTQAGKRIRALSKHGNADIARAAGEVVAAWKEVVRREADAGPSSSSQLQRGGSQGMDTTTQGAQPSSRSDGGGGGGGAGAGGAKSEGGYRSEGGGAAQLASQPSSSAATSALRPASGEVAAAAAAAFDPGSLPRAGDAVRDKCRLNLALALQMAVVEGSGNGGAVAAVAAEVETEIYKAHGGVTAAYKAKFRNLHFNMKDEKNPDLRRKVLTGEISPAELITLPAEELASDAKREENAAIREKKLFHAAPSAQKQATTDQFQCGKCRQRKCTYYQMQTRSADEPMTTFVTCLNCNNRWKFC